MNKSPFFLPLCIALTACIFITACSHRNEVHRCSGAIWATTYNITYIASDDLDADILVTLKDVEHSLSPFDSSSVVSLINRNESMATDSMLQNIFHASQSVCRLSHGAFDPTVAPLVNLWGFGYNNSQTPPSDVQIDSALSYVGILRCSIDANGAMSKPSPMTEFNFSAITKGFGCDMVGEMLSRHGVVDYMVEIGGEIALSGLNPEGEKWHIQIDAPIEESGSVSHTPQLIISLTDCGIATSGNYRNFHNTSQGKTWHTIDPSTGRPVVTPMLSVTVIAPNCMMADALATACMAMQPADALALINSLDDVEAILIVADGDTIKTIRSAGFVDPIS
ncbi:MAG: FAD:protein FMN transferase [Bacteroides sp.]|nr:FAD:protein FMN transferase [Bacteroides sp.]MCM1413223.1 FAD:protein FMN transferase [Bacteroides sp.]MCM1471467.1 FAD:protein FMN transferase [Bacteroides sp.]